MKKEEACRIIAENQKLKLQIKQDEEIIKMYVGMYDELQEEIKEQNDEIIDLKYELKQAKEPHEDINPYNEYGVSERDFH